MSKEGDVEALSRFRTMQQLAHDAGLTRVAIDKRIRRGSLDSVVAYGVHLIHDDDADTLLAERAAGRPGQG